MREREKRMENLRVSAGRAIGHRRRAAATLLVALAVCLLPTSAAAAGGFRLGTAASPFGWATATADFDGDGRPDFAIVDRVGSAGGRFAIDIEVASAPAQRFVLTSSYDAVTVLVVDVDHDNDLDIVVTPALTGEVLSVWLNDGFGRFSPAARDHSRRVVPRHLLTSVPATERGEPAIASKRVVSGWRAARDWIRRADETCSLIFNRSAVVYRVVNRSSAALRAPPDLPFL